MELSRQEYPGLLSSLEPARAVQLLQDRVRHISKTNTDIADWLEERKRVEEVYVQGLKRLARKQPPDDNSELGVFTTPWQKMVSHVEVLADAHSQLSQRITVDVEKPLRDFSGSNREMLQLSSAQGNLASLAKDYESAQKKASKGGRSGGNKAGEGADSAFAQWESQAPYVFENLQAVDESRCNHLRDILTQLETHEADCVEKSRRATESVLNSLLSVDTADEVRTFVTRSNDAALQSQAAARKPRRDSRMMPNSIQPISTQPQPGAARLGDRMPSREDRAPSRDSATNTSTHRDAFSDVPEPDDVPAEKKGRLGGIRRLGTVLGRGKKKNEEPASRKRETKFGGGLRPDRSSRIPEQSSPPMQSSPNAGYQLPPLNELGSQSPTEPRPMPIRHRSNEEMRSPTNVTTNGSFDNDPPATRQLDGNRANVVTETPVALQNDEGAPSPPEKDDPIAQAQAEAQAAQSLNDPSAQGLKVDIKNAPIEEEGVAASAAMASMATTLRAQATPRRQTTLRGRRDNRNTIVVENPATGTSPYNFDHMPGGVRTNTLQTLSSPTDNQPTFARTDSSGPASMGLPSPTFQTPISTVQPHQNLPNAATQSQSELPSQVQAPSSVIAPVAAVGAVAIGAAATAAATSIPYNRAGPSESNASDAGSIRSGRSMNSLTQAVRHPDLISGGSKTPGLRASIVETVSATLEQGALTKCAVIGELALAYLQGQGQDTPPHETIRLDNFHILEKVAPNPAFINPTAGGKPGEYQIDPFAISRGTNVSFKYQVHLDESAVSGGTSNSTRHAPILFSTAWKIEERQASAIVSYRLNSAFLPGTDRTVDLKLNNVVIVLYLEGANVRTTSCQSKPTGTFSKEQKLIYWRFDELNLAASAEPQKLLARFMIEGTAPSPGRVEAKWELTVSDALANAGIGSGLEISKLDSSSTADPFADQANTSGSGWSKVESVKKIVSGTYSAT